METASESNDAETGPACRTAVTEVWPAEFELRIETGRDSPTTTVHTLDAAQLRALGDRIDEALEDAE